MQVVLGSSVKVAAGTTVQFYVDAGGVGVECEGGSRYNSAVLC